MATNLRIREVSLLTMFSCFGGRGVGCDLGDNDIDKQTMYYRQVPINLRSDVL